MTDTQADKERDMMYELIEKELQEGRNFWICPVCGNIFKSKDRPVGCPNLRCHAFLLLPFTLKDIQ